MTSFAHLFACARRAARGKRHRPGVASFLFRLERVVLQLQRSLRDGTWEPGGYREFIVHEPKTRLISAAPFAVRVVHHAVVGVLEPVFEPTFVFDSYACRSGKGTHRAVERYQAWSRSSRFFLKMDVQRFFPSVDHALLLDALARKIKDPRVFALARQIVEGSNPQEPATFYFPGDELFTPWERRRGLPIGNQTSQFFSNVYLNPLDHFVKDRLRIPRYLRYVDDLVVMGDSRRDLHRIRESIEEFCWSLRLRFNPIKCFAAPVDQGLRLLGYRVFPDRVRLAPENLTRRRHSLRRQAADVARGILDLSSVEASIRAWIGHASHADSWSIREKILGAVVFCCPGSPDADGREFDVREADDPGSPISLQPSEAGSGQPTKRG